MTPAQLLAVYATELAVALAIAGLLMRGHARFCRGFVVYLSTGLLYSLLVALWPDTFFVRAVWLPVQVGLDVLKIAAVLELGCWIFLGFPGAAATARGSLFLLLVGLLVVVLFLPSDPEGTDGGWIVARLSPVLQTATVVTFTAIAFFVVWYRLPVHPIHRAIMIGMVPYLTVSTTVFRVVTIYGWSVQVFTLEPFAHLAACTWWAFAAWQPAREVAPIIAVLQPWRVRA